MKLFLFLCCLLAASCNRNNDPLPDPAKLLIGKWRLVNVAGLNNKTGELVSKKQTDPNYSVFEFVKPDRLYSYQVSDSSRREDCTYAGQYKVEKYAVDGHFTLENQVYIVFGCPGQLDPTYIGTQGFRVDQNKLTMENDRSFYPIHYTYAYTRLP